jgi:hypothetical protein
MLRSCSGALWAEPMVMISQVAKQWFYHPAVLTVPGARQVTPSNGFLMSRLNRGVSGWSGVSVSCCFKCNSQQPAPAQTPLGATVNPLVVGSSPTRGANKSMIYAGPAGDDNQGLSSRISTVLVVQKHFSGPWVTEIPSQKCGAAGPTE